MRRNQLHFCMFSTAMKQARGACASFVFGFVTFMSIGGFPSFVEDMKVCTLCHNLKKLTTRFNKLNFFSHWKQVFQRERMNGHYGVGAFVVSNTLSAMPFLILITFLSGTVCYFMVRLHPGFTHYLFFVVCLYASVTVVESLMMVIASVVPNFLMGIIIGAGIQVLNFHQFPFITTIFGSLIVLFSCWWLGNIYVGLWILQTSQWHPKTFLALPYVLPQFPLLGTTGKTHLLTDNVARLELLTKLWMLQGQYQNDLMGLEFDNSAPGLPKIPGEFILEQIFQIDLHRSKWVDVSVIFVMIIAYRIIFFIMIKINEDVTPWIRGYIARRKMQQKNGNQKQTIAPYGLTQSPSLRAYVGNNGPNSNR